MLPTALSAKLKRFCRNFYKTLENARYSRRWVYLPGPIPWDILFDIIAIIKYVIRQGPTGLKSDRDFNRKEVEILQYGDGGPINFFYLNHPKYVPGYSYVGG